MVSHRVRLQPDLMAHGETRAHSRSTYRLAGAVTFCLARASPATGAGCGTSSGRFEASDGNPDPIQYAFLAGIGGKGVVPGRPDDSFGIGLARTQFSSAFLPFLRQQFNLGLQREDAIEMYYNMAITPWMNLTSDLQIVDSALDKAISPTTGKLTGIDTVVVAGARIRVRF